MPEKDEFRPVAPPQAGAGNPDKDASGTEDEKLLSLAKSQFQQVRDAESVNRNYQRDDQRFRAASPDDNYQWPSELLNARRQQGDSARPCLTLNKLPGHVNQVVNDWRQNRPQFKYSPVDSGADPKVADILNGIVRHIQAASDADIAYDNALDGAVVAGVGYIRVLTDYVDPMSFDQDILIRQVRDPLTVYMDPFIQQPDGSDARFCFVVEDMPRRIFEHEWPDQPVDGWDTTGAYESWLSQEAVRVAEWWNIEYRERTLCQYADGSTGWKDEGQGKGEPVRERKVDFPEVVFRRITCGAILETIKWPGRYIPIARTVGNEYRVDGKLIVSGLIRNAKDAMRMYNYWASQEVEMLALAPKAPFIAPIGSLAGRETQWKMANTVNYAVLEYNAFVLGPDGQMHKVEAPQRALPPMPQQAIIQAKLAAADDIKSTTGQYDASLGQRSNETSGRAILARQREGDVGTFHYIDNTVRALRHVGRIIVDLVPKIYDRPDRIVRIIGEDGTPDFVRLDPRQQRAVIEQVDEQTREVERIYNPGVGRYDVTVTIGPSYTTKRQETADTLTEIVRASPDLMRVIGDKALGALDLADQDAITKRMRAYLLPEVVQAEEAEDGQPAQPPIPPQVQQDIQNMMQALEAAQAKIAELEDERRLKAAEVDIKAAEAQTDAYRAETERLQALGPALNPQQLAQLAAQIVMDALRGPGPEGINPGGSGGGAPGPMPMPAAGPMPAEAAPGMMPPGGMPPAMDPGPVADVGGPMGAPPGDPGAGMGGMPPGGPIGAPGPQDVPPGAL